MNGSLRSQGIGLLLLSSLLFGAMSVFVRLALREVTLGQMLLMRFSFAFVGAWVASRQLPPSSGGNPRLLIYRGVLGGFAVLTYFESLRLLPAAIGAVLNTSSSLFAMGFAWWLLGERPPRSAAIGVVAAATGTALVVAGAPHGNGEATVRGLVAGLLSAVLSGAAVTATRAARRHYNAGTVFLGFSIGGLAVALPQAAVDGLPTHGLGWAVVAATVAFFGQLVSTQALGMARAWLASAVGQLIPLVAWGMGLLFLGESLTPLAATGALLTCVGVALSVAAAQR